jgi:HTH-type transcriptional regulator/antitoxin HigA
MDIRPILNDADLKWALAEVEQYFDHEPQRGTPESIRFEILSTLIEAYEDKTVPIGTPEPVEFLVWFMDMTGRTKADLADLVGSEVRANDILSGRGGLTIEVAYLLNSKWNVPADVLLRAGRQAA